MRKLIEFFISHLLYFFIKNINCEINSNLLNYQKDVTDVTPENFISSNIINEENSYIIDLNSVNKNKRLKNNYSKLLNNALYNYGNTETLRNVLDKGNNINEKAKLHEERNFEKESRKIGSSFMLINKHNTENDLFKKNENEKYDKLYSEKITEKNCRKIQKEKSDKKGFIEKNDNEVINNSKPNQLTNEASCKNISKKKKKTVEPILYKYTDYNSNVGDKINSNFKKTQEEKNISLHENYTINDENRIKSLKNSREKLNLLFLGNITNDYTGNNYFEIDKYVKLEYPINNKKKRKINKYAHRDMNQINNKINKKSVFNNNNLNFIKYTDDEDNNSKENEDNENYVIDDSDLLDILKDGYKPDNIVCTIKKNKNPERKKKIDEENYEDFDLKDALIDDIDNKNIKSIEDKEKNEHNKNKKPDNTNNDIYSKLKLNNPDTHLSLKYLGLGYDIIMGNPEGDPTLNIDPGFRGPVLQINLEKINLNNNNININNNNNNNDSKRSTPWVIPEHSCSQSRNVEEIRNLEQYKLELLSDVKVSTASIFPYSFSASVEFKNALEKLKVQNNVIFLMKIYCLRYYTGIPTTTLWKFTDHFKKALNNLPSTFDGLKEGSLCTYEDYINKINTPECEENVNKWIIFFKLHGTHVAHEIYLGGKIILKMNIDKNEYNKLKENNLSMKPFFNFYFHKMGLSSSFSKQTQSILSKFNISKNISILGGNPGLDVENSSFFERWVNSIGRNSMPIRTKLLPFSFFMKDPNMIQAYKDALTFYGLSYGVRIIDQEKYNNGVLSIGEYLEKCTQKLYAGPPPGLLTCPIGSSLLMGFSINLDFYKSKKLSNTIGMISCEQMKESCSGNGFENNYSDTRIWGLCSNNPLEFITQVVQQGESPKVTATCPRGLVILFGFALMKGMGSSSANNVDIYPCRTGQTSCSAVLQNSKFKQSMIYVACVDRTTNGLEHIQTFSQIKNMGYVVPSKFKEDGYLNFSCPSNNTLVFGFSLEFHTNFPSTRNNFLYCSKFTNSCEIGGIGINTRLSFFRADMHSLAIIAVCRSHIEENKTNKNE
ncbi:perforin like protein 2, putative [Plasmodium gallinaceum]|uniref:Perforin like protein 2, putative n=1 Tax=Plasmodium gallinaceum TaxID=5849 RepID=A0A1J1GZ60_PLAGA|nr:perforin like protein 2, putative [Plasmodium gallinaceum]CRG97736.1 perforin like protein 2, putative [Plasmodium gallinaceum]